MNRRQALNGLAAVGSVSLAGCASTLGSDDSRTVLGRLEVLNSSFVRNRIRLMVDRDDETLLDRKLSLPPLDSANGTPGVVIEPLWSETRGRYTVRAIHYDESDDRESQSWEYTFTRADYDIYSQDSREDPGCLGGIVKIGSLDETENAAIAIGPAYMENPCGTSDSR